MLENHSSLRHKYKKGVLGENKFKSYHRGYFETSPSIVQFEFQVADTGNKAVKPEQ